MNYIRDSPDNKFIREGDTCAIYISEHSRYILKIHQDNKIQTKFGQLVSLDLVGHPYGVRFESKKGWILPLRLTPELWTKLLPHRTQILYQADVSLILLQLDIKPESIVIESGTGSGSLSHVILRAILPNGCLHTFDINESRVDQARQEFIEHGFENNVKVYKRNVCDQGFPEDLNGKADACILDLPQTWNAIEHAYRVLKPNNSRLCTFSPCIEQVQQNVAKMNELKLKDIVTMECLLRQYEVRPQTLRLWTEDVLEKMVKVDEKRIENFKHSLESADMDVETDANLGNPSHESIHQKTSDDISDGNYSEQLKKALSDPKAPFTPHMLPKSSQLYARPPNESISHSGFLTFASKRA